jgi:hypothetical protein
MQVDRVPGQVYTHLVAHVNAHPIGRVSDFDIAGADGKIECVRFIKHPGPEQVVGFGSRFAARGHIRHEILQFEIVKVDRQEKDAEEDEPCDERRGGGHAPAGHACHDAPFVPRSESLLAAHRSFQRSGV